MALLRLFLLIPLFYLLGAALSQPGTHQDPVVSKSYLQAFYQFRIVSVPPGQKMVLGTGTEVVLRSGRAEVVGNGLLDLSRGEDLGAGRALPPNHHLLCPRDDGRGLRTRTKVLLLVRGSYQFE